MVQLSQEYPKLLVWESDSSPRGSQELFHHGVKRDNEINQNFGKGSSRNSLVAALAVDRKIKKEGKKEGIKEKMRKRTEREGGEKAEMK